MMKKSMMKGGASFDVSRDAPRRHLRVITMKDDHEPKKRATTKLDAVSEETRRWEAQKLTVLWDAAKDNTSNHLSQAAFAKKYKVGGQAFINQMLGGERSINLKVGMKFASYLRCSIADFSPRLRDELAIYVAFAKGDQKFDDLIAMMTPETADLWRKYHFLAEHDKKDIAKIIMDRHTSMIKAIELIGGKSAAQKLSKLTKPNELID